MAGGFPFSLFMLLPVLFWVVSLYLMLRFLRAIEEGVRAHSRVADALERTAGRPPQAFGDRTS